MTNSLTKPHILVLGGNFAGLGVAQKLRDFAGDSVRITLIDRKTYLLFVPNIPADIFENRDSALHQRMDLVKPLTDDDVGFIHAEVTGIDVDTKSVTFRPAERPGAESQKICYDYLVVALGNRLAYDRIEGFAENGHAISDIYHGNRLRHYLHNEYKGGGIAVGAAWFHQGDGASALEPYPGGSIPIAEAACEGPVVEAGMAAVNWLEKHGKGTGRDVTIFTPAALIAEDAGVENVRKLLRLASEKDVSYFSDIKDVRRLTDRGIDFADGRSLEAEVRIILPDWVAHDILQGLPISDNQGFIVTDLLMRNPRYPEVFACGDAAAATVPKLGAIGHQQSEIVARQIACDLGKMSREDADTPLKPMVYCIGDTGAHSAFYIRANTYFGGDTEVLEIGHIPYALKMQYRRMFMASHGRIPPWGLTAAELAAERLSFLERSDR